MRNESGFTGISFIIMVALVFLITGACGAMTPESKAINAAEDVGYTDVTVVDKSIFFTQFLGCGKEDTARFTVRGVSPRDEVREVHVCAGVLKGGTVRSK